MLCLCLKKILFNSLHVNINGQIEMFFYLNIKQHFECNAMTKFLDKDCDLDNFPSCK